MSVLSARKRITKEQEAVGNNAGGWGDTGCKMLSTIAQYNDKLDTIKPQCPLPTPPAPLLSLSSPPVSVLLREHTVGFPMTGFGSFCQPATAPEG